MTIEAHVERVWRRLQADARSALGKEAMLEDMVHRLVLDHDSLAGCLAATLAARLGGSMFTPDRIAKLAESVFRDPATLVVAARDIEAAWSRNVASDTLLAPALFQKGTCALYSHRMASHFWQSGMRETAAALQSVASDRLAIDIHPAATVGAGIFIDHGTGVVIGETAIVEDNVAIWQGVCLGSSFKSGGQRHPVIRRGAALAAGALILGAVEIGANAVVAAGSVVIHNVPPGVTVAGVPARVVSQTTNIALVMPIAGKVL